MPMTSSQATVNNVANSLKAYINTNIIIPYNTAVAATVYPTPCSIGLAWPDDPDVFQSVPRIIIELPFSDMGQAQATGLGDRIVYRFKKIMMAVYPGLTTDGKPSVQSMAALMDKFDYALGTSLYIPIMDYSVGPVVQVEAMEVLESRIIGARGKQDPTLGMDRHRFDFSMAVKYPQTTIGS